MTDKVMVEAFRGDASFVMPEIFYQALILIRHFRNLQSGIHVFKYCRPRLKDCRGDEEVGIHVFTEEEGKIHRGFPLLLFRFLIEPLRNDGQRDDRGIQG